MFLSSLALPVTFSSGSANLYRLTLPASLSPSSSWKRIRFVLAGKMQSGSILMKNPRMPRLAASIAAYSNRRVESDVQYWTVAGGGVGETIVSGSCGSGSVGN